MSGLGAAAIGRLTLRGGPEVESALRSLLQRATARVAERVPRPALRALLLLGGYGRGEGGVLVEHGRERPHNNLDLLLATRGLRAADRARLKLALDRELEPLAREADVGIDLSVKDAAAIARDECRVIWYDARHGHKTLLGDATFLPRIERFRLERVVSADALDLLVNRGSLLLINELLIARDPGGSGTRRHVVKHAAKAVIGYGDALLFFLGAYDWSYAEKQRRMAARPDVPAALRALYEQAMEFRFRPDYATFAPIDLASWNRELLVALEPAHRQAEALRLGDPALRWEGYAARALARSLVEGGLAPRSLAGRLRRLLRGGAALGEGPVLARLGYRALGPGAALRAFFPVVAYGAGGEADRRLAEAALRPANPSRPALVRAYLRAWGRHRDFNLEPALGRMGLSLEEAAWA